MQVEIEFEKYTTGLDNQMAERWVHGAELAVTSVHNITAHTWQLASALAEMLWAGGEARLIGFWKHHLRGVLTRKVMTRLVRLWEAFKNHPDRDLIGPDVWAIIHTNISDEELIEVEQMAKANATPEELRERIESIGRAAEARRQAQPFNEDAVKMRVREWLENQGIRVDGEVMMSNGRVCDLVTDDMVIECKAMLTLTNWDKAIGQVDSYQWCRPNAKRVLAFQNAAEELQILIRQAIDNGYKLLAVDPARKECEWIR